MNILWKEEVGWDPCRSGFSPGAAVGGRCSEKREEQEERPGDTEAQGTLSEGPEGTESKAND